MRMTIALAALALAAPAAAQQHGESAEGVKAGLRTMYAELDRAVQAKDRAALERIFVPEFVWVHGFGYADDREDHIAGVLSVDGPRRLPPLHFEPPNHLLIYGKGEVALLRQPGRPTQLADRVWGSAIYVKRDGRWQIAQIHGTIMQAERAYVTLDSTALDALAGRYSAESGRVTVISREGPELRARLTGVPIRRLRPVAANRFFDKLGSEYVFERGPDGKVRELRVLFPGGRESRLPRVE